MSENTPHSTPPPEPPRAGPAPAPGSPPPTAPGVVPMLESEARTWAMLVHIIAAAAMVVSAGFLGFVAPLVIWLIYRERSALVDFHGKQNLNLQLTLLVVGVAAFVLGLVTLGFGFLLTLPAWGAYGLYALIISIIAGIKANAGEYYRIGFVIRFIR